MAMKREPTHGPDGLPLDPLAVLREPLYVRAERVRGFGMPESIPLPNEGRQWNIDAVRGVRGVIEQVSGGGDFKVYVTDIVNQTHAMQFHIEGPERKLAVAPPPLASTAQYGATAVAAPVPIQLGMGLTAVSLPGGQTMILPTGEQHGEGAASQWPRPPWGPFSGWPQPPQPQNNNADLMRELERERAARERVEQEAKHTAQLAELKHQFEKLSDDRRQGSQSSDLATVMEKFDRRFEEMQRQIAAKDDQNRHTQELAEMRRQHSEEVARLRDELKPKDDPLIRSMLETRREEAAAGRDAAKETAAAMRESSREQRDMLNLVVTTLKGDQATFIPMLTNAYGSLAQLQQAQTASLIDVLKEVAELRKDGETPWYGRLMEGFAQHVGPAAAALAEGYSAGQQAKAPAPPPPVIEATAAVPPGRQPRQAVPPAPVPPKAVEAGPAASPVPRNGAQLDEAQQAIEAGLRGYEPMPGIPNDAEAYDQAIWGPALAEIRQIRRAAHEGKLTPELAAQSLVSLIHAKESFNLADQIQAFKQLDGNPVSLASFVGMALGRAPQGQDEEVHQQFKRQTLKLFAAGLQELVTRMSRATQVRDGGGEGDGSGGDEDEKAPGN